MGFMDGIKKLTQPYDEDNDFFDGAEKPKAAPVAAAPVSGAQAEFENTFGMEGAPAPEPARRAAEAEDGDSAGSLFGNLGSRRPRPAPRERGTNGGGDPAQMMVFTPRCYDDAKQLVGFLKQRRSVVMTMDSLSGEQARRFMDLCSGVALALQGKITPVNGTTYFVTPIDVNIIGSQAPVESDEQYF